MRRAEGKQKRECPGHDYTFWNYDEQYAVVVSVVAVAVAVAVAEETLGMMRTTVRR